ncbi:MAG: response regulator [Leptolyngbyaceae bacterium]|nr:response regulator [Leptolyngbyaceae bacterium]
MQGELNEIDIRSILQLVELGQRTGELYVESYALPKGNWAGDRPRHESSTPPSWFVFFLNGSITYAADHQAHNLQRLNDHLKHLGIHHSLPDTTAPAIATTNAPEYGYLWALLENHILTPHQGRAIVHSMVRESLFDLLSLHQGAFIFEVGPSLAPQLANFRIDPLVGEVMQQVQLWKQLSPNVQSPDQYPVLLQRERLKDALPPDLYRGLVTWANGQTSIRQLSRLIGQSILSIGQALYPHIQEGTIQLTAHQPQPESPGEQSVSHPMRSHDYTPRVVCIDDGLTLRKTVETILGDQGYEVTSIASPTKALSLVFQLKPDLILCDIAMPQLDGYEVCAMLRKSTAFRQTPIVMLTGKDGFIDRVKARMVGATDYLTKPFGESELLLLIEKYVGLGTPNRENPNKLLAEAVKNELEINISGSVSSPSSV